MVRVFTTLTHSSIKSFAQLKIAKNPCIPNDFFPNHGKEKSDNLPFGATPIVRKSTGYKARIRIIQ